MTGYSDTGTPSSSAPYAPPSARARPTAHCTTCCRPTCSPTACARLVERTGVDPVEVDDVIAGAVTQVGDQAVNIARNALLGAGFPETVPGTTVDRQCGSSQQAISFAAQGVLAGAYDIVIAAGVESMSRVPMGSSVLPGSEPVRRRHRRALPRGSGAPGHQRRADRRQVGPVPRRARRVLRGQPRKGRRAQPRTGCSTTNWRPIAGLSTDEIIRPGTTVETLAGLKPAFYNEADRRALPADRLARSRRATRRRCPTAAPR